VPRRNQPIVRKRSRRGSSRQSGAKTAGGSRPRIGQHFLTNPLTAHDVVDAAALRPDEDVVEVGPGRGAITGLLVERARTVVAVELDEDLASALRRSFSGVASLTVVCESVLAHSPDQVLAEAGREPPYVVVANLPYYITAPVMRHFLEAGPRPQRMIVMVQREVAESIAGMHGGLSLLGISVQVFGAVRVLFRVPPESFTPPPRVDSAVIRIDVYDEPLVPEADLAGFFTVVRSGFRNPRKQLHNALGEGLWLPPAGAGELLQRADIDPIRRAGTLTIEEWLRLYRAYEAAKPAFPLSFVPPDLAEQNTTETEHDRE